MAFLHRRAAAHADDPADTFDQPPCLAVGLAPVDSLMHPIAGVFPAGTRARPFTLVWFCPRPVVLLWTLACDRDWYVGRPAG